MSEIKFKLNQIEKLNWLSHLYFLRNDYNNCEKIYSLEQSDYNKYIQGLICLHKDVNIEKCLKYIDLIHSKNEIEYCKLKAKCLLLAKNSQLIQLVKEEYLKQFPSDWQFWEILGIGYLNDCNIKLAKEAFQQALKTTNRIDSFFYLSKCHKKEKDIKSAINVLKKANELGLNNKKLKIKLGLLQYTNNNKSEGVDVLMELYNISATTIDDLRMSLAIGFIIQENQSDVDNAIIRYKLANKFESPAICNNVALCYIEKKKYIAAVSCFKRSLYLNVFDWRVNYNLGLLYLQLKQYASAFHYLKSSITMSNKKKNGFLLLAVCLEHLDDEFNTINAYEKAVKYDSNHSQPISLINYCIYLYKNDFNKNRNKIIELLMQFEQNHRFQEKNLDKVDNSLINIAKILSTKLNINFNNLLHKEKNQIETSV